MSHDVRGEHRPFFRHNANPPTPLLPLLLLFPFFVALVALTHMTTIFSIPILIIIMMTIIIIIIYVEVSLRIEHDDACPSHPLLTPSRHGADRDLTPLPRQGRQFAHHILIIMLLLLLLLLHIIFIILILVLGEDAGRVLVPSTS